MLFMSDNLQKTALKHTRLVEWLEQYIFRKLSDQILTVRDFVGGRLENCLAMSKSPPCTCLGYHYTVNAADNDTQGPPNLYRYIPISLHPRTTILKTRVGTAATASIYAAYIVISGVYRYKRYISLLAMYIVINDIVISGIYRYKRCILL
jgi:hypothetical protein